MGGQETRIRPSRPHLARTHLGGGVFYAFIFHPLLCVFALPKQVCDNHGLAGS